MNKIFSLFLRFLPLFLVTSFLIYLSTIPNLKITNSEEYEFIVRKIGHALAYGTLFFASWHSLNGNKFFAFLYTVFVGSIDEYIQVSSWGRYGTIRDVIIDSIGALVFMILLTDILPKAKKVLVVGGGTGGHSVPAIIIAKSLAKEGIKVATISEINGLTAKLAKDNNIKNFSIFSSRPRSYNKFSILLFPFTFSLSFINSLFLILLYRPKVVFAKGGFLSIPVALACVFFRIPFLLHESDLTMSKSAKILGKISVRVFHGMSKNPDDADGQILDEEFEKYLKNKEKNKKSIILVTGGSLGASELNNAIDPEKFSKYEVYHQHGNTIKPSSKENYHPKDFFDPLEMRKIMMKSDLIICRAGSTTLGEINALGKRAIILPLRHVGRLDQPANAKYFAKDRIATKILDKNPTSEDMSKAIEEVLELPEPPIVKQEGRKIVLMSIKNILNK